MKSLKSYPTFTLTRLVVLLISLTYKEKNMVKNIKQRLKATFCVLAMAILLIPITGKALSKTEIESQREAIEEQQNDLEEALAELVGKQEEVEAYSVLLNQKITITEDSIDLAIESISQINSDILSLEKDLLSSQQKYETALENLKVRLVSLYETGEISSLEILLSSSSLYDFSLKTEALQLIAEHDVELMEEIQQYISETETLRTQLASQKELVAENKLLLERDQADLELLMKENNEVLKEILANQGDLDQQLSELATDDQELLEQY